MSINTATLVENVETVEVDAEPMKVSSVTLEGTVEVDEGGFTTSIAQSSTSITISQANAKSVDRINESSINVTLKVDTAAPPEPTPWTPSQLTTKLWLDASDATTITQSSGNVSQWDDKSGNDFHATQNADGEQPETGDETQNGLNALTFDGTEWMTTGDVNISSQPTTVFSIARVRSTGLSGRNYVFDGAEGDNIYRNLFALDGNNTDKYSAWAEAWLASTVSTDANYHVFECVYNDTAGVIGVDATRVTGNAGDRGNLTKGINIGTNYTDSADFLDGYIGEIVIVYGLLSEDDRENMEGYLAHKWGLESNLPSEHPYKAEAPTV